MTFFKKILSYYWLIIPAIVGIVLFSMPWWYTKLLLAPFYDSINESIEEDRSNVSLVDYSIPFNLKIRHISIWDIADENKEEAAKVFPDRPKNYNYYADDIARAHFLLDSLKGRKTSLTIEMTLNIPVDTLNPAETKKLHQYSMDLVGQKILEKATYSTINIFKETDFIIQYKKESSIAPYNERAVLLKEITF